MHVPLSNFVAMIQSRGREVVWSELFCWCETGLIKRRANIAMLLNDVILRNVILHNYYR